MGSRIKLSCLPEIRPSAFSFSSTGKERAIGGRRLFVTWNLRTYTIFELLHALQVSTQLTTKGGV